MQTVESACDQIIYSIPNGVRVLSKERAILSTSDGGKVVLDEPLMQLWQDCDQKNLQQILDENTIPSFTRNTIRSALSCLAEAKLIERSWKPPVYKTKIQRGGLVSVIITTYKGEDWIPDCLESLKRQCYSPIEIIVVDNHSNWQIKPWLSKHYKDVRVISHKFPVSLAAAENSGVRVAKGQFYLLMNDDTILKPDAIAEMVKAFERDATIAAVAPKLKFYWARSFFNGIGNRVGSHSWGTDNAIGHLDLGQYDDWQEIPSVCTAAAMFLKEAWKRIGEMDEAFPIYYDDAEWSYRARLMGYKIHLAPKSVIYHAFGGRVPSGEPEDLPVRKLECAVYGRLRFALKLLQSYRTRFIFNYLWEDLTNATGYLIRGQWRYFGAYLMAWKKILLHLPKINTLRKKIQSHRVSSDPDLFDMQRDYLPGFTKDGLPLLTSDLVNNYYHSLISKGETHHMPEFSIPPKKPHVLLISHDVITDKMGGPGLRYYDMAIALSDYYHVTLAVPQATEIKHPKIAIVRYWDDIPESLEVLVENHDIALISGYMSIKFPFLERSSTKLIVDLYDPIFFENMYYYFERPIDEQLRLNEQAVEVTNRIVRIGDYFICGTEKQRDFWLGLLTSCGRVNPKTFSDDPTLRKLIDVVGLAYPARQPIKRPVLRGTYPIIPKNSKIVLWGGGIWNWLDPITLVNAWPQVIKKHKNARLVFLGVKAPNPSVPAHRVSLETVRLAQEIGEKDKSILFIDWLTYDDYESALLEADIGVTFQPDHIESHFSIRARIISYFWAHLPVLLSEGDVTADWVKKHQLGKVVPIGDANAVAAALNDMLGKTKESWNLYFNRIDEMFSAGVVLKPIVDYCMDSRFAPDRLDRKPAQMPSQVSALPLHPVIKALQVARTEGVGAMVRRTIYHLKWMLHKV